MSVERYRIYISKKVDHIDTEEWKWCEHNIKYKE